jgi:hypothetical protein
MKARKVTVGGLAPAWITLALSLALVTTLLGGCERIAPIRTLPSWVRGIYIPVFKNESYEPGIEEQATILTQEAFLADGRLDVVHKQDADTMLVVKIVEWRESGGGHSGDKITDEYRAYVRAAVQLYEPYGDKTLLADLGEVRVDDRFHTDTRSSWYEAEPDRKERLLRSLADQIMMRTLTGFPINVVSPGAPTAPLPASPMDVHSEHLLQSRSGATR